MHNLSQGISSGLVTFHGANSGDRRMRRGLFFALAVIVALFGIATPPSAVPLLVDMKIRDPLTANAPQSGDDAVAFLSPDNGKGNGKGGNGGYCKADLKGLTLWLSHDGKSWKALDGEVLDLS